MELGTPDNGSENRLYGDAEGGEGLKQWGVVNSSSRCAVIAMVQHYWTPRGVLSEGSGQAGAGENGNVKT